MKIFITSLTVLFFSFNAIGQQTNSTAAVLSLSALNKVLTPALKSQMGIEYPIRRAMECNDKSGQFYLVFTESNNGYSDGDTLHKHIKIMKLAVAQSGINKVWEIKDFTQGEDETSISAWLRTSEITDVDNDGLIDPIVVYGTSALNDLADGRVKIIVCYKDEKIAIRHQNSTMDGERSTQVDKAFYKLPVVLQKKVRAMMQKMADNGFVIFPSEWKTAMDSKRLKFGKK